MSIPGKMLIALLSALAVSAAAGGFYEQHTLGSFFPTTVIAALLAVVLSHRALPMPGSLNSTTTTPATLDDSSTTKPEQKSRQKPGQKAERKGNKPSKAPSNTGGTAESGTVKWFNGTKGFGFIIRGNGEEIFVHHRSILGEGRRSLRDGEAVKFKVVTTDKGPQAEEVEALE